MHKVKCNLELSSIPHGKAGTLLKTRPARTFRKLNAKCPYEMQFEIHPPLFWSKKNKSIPLTYLCWGEENIIPGVEGVYITTDLCIVTLTDHFHYYNYQNSMVKENF
jgi:hypothetical protein